MQVGDGRAGWFETGLWWLVMGAVLSTALSVGSLGLAQGTQIEVEVVDAGGNPFIPYAIIYKAGAGDWQPLTPPDLQAGASVSIPARSEALFTFTLPEGETHYQVAVSCGGLAAYFYVLYVLTTDVTSLYTPCLENQPFYPAATLGGRIGYSSPGDLIFGLQTRVGSGRVIDPSGGYSVAADVGEAQDLVVLASTPAELFGPPSEVVAGRVVHDLDVVEGYNDFDLLLGEEAAVTDHGALAVPEVPDGYSAGLQAFFVSRGGVAPSISAGRRDYPVLPGAAEGDRYLGVASARAQDKQSELFHLRLSDKPEDFEFTLPPPWPPYSLGPAPQPIFKDLTHLRDDPELRAYQIDVSAFGGRTRVVISPAYLGSETSYALPDLTSLYGFESSRFSGQPNWQLRAVLADQPLSVLLATPTVILELGSSSYFDDRLRLADLPRLDLRIATVNSKPFLF